MNTNRRSVRAAVVWLGGLAVLAGVLGLGVRMRATISSPYVVLAYNELGMHCMQGDNSELMVLPPFNTLRATVIRRGTEPDIMNGDVSVSYVLPGVTTAADKNNFWAYPQAMLGNPAPDVGVAGKGLAGTMGFDAGTGDFAAVGIPMVPTEDNGRENAYALASVTVRLNSSVVARTQAVVPVSTEMSCSLCHNTPGESVGTSILRSHDRLHGTDLVNHKPVMCAACHSDNALGAPGQPGVSSLSSAMHTAHAPRMAAVNLTNECYACHPGVRTNCQRDVHASRGLTCVSCHQSMAAVGNPARRPWLDVPRCADCHHRAGFEYEQPGVPFKLAVGHAGVKCIACHSSPHAVTPALTPTDNAQANLVQGMSGVIRDCTVCHNPGPPGAFFHAVSH